MASLTEPKELVDISKAIDLLCLLNINDLKSALRTLEGGSLGVFLGDNTNKHAINIEKVAGTLPRHLLAHIVTGERNFMLTHPGMPSTSWLAYTAKGLHLINCFIGLEFHYPRLAAVQRGLEHRSCIFDLLLLAGAVWNTELAGATTFSHFVLCAEGIRLTYAAIGTALQHDLDRGAESKLNDPHNTASSSSHIPHSISAPPLETSTTTPSNIHNGNNNNNTTSNIHKQNKSLPYSYEWYDALIINPKIHTFTALPVDTVNLLQKVIFRALQSSPDHVPKLCRSFHTQLEALFLMCCSEEYVGHLLLHPEFVEGELLNILQQALSLWKSPWSASKQALTASGGIAGASAANAFQQNDPIASVATQILRVLYVLFEKENPCFLDTVAASEGSFQHMLTIISTITQLSYRILDTSTCGPSALESFKLIEILSDDSNFKNEIISRVTPLLVQLLSFPPATLEALFSAPPLPSSPEQQQRDFMIVVFRVVGNLHCFNEHLCKPEDKGLFLRTISAEMTKPNTTSTFANSKKNAEITLLVLANLSYLLRTLITERQVFHLNTEELDLVTSFTQSLQQSLSLPSPPPSSTLSSGDVTLKRKHADTLEVQ